MKKKGIALILVVVLFLSFLPQLVMAKDTMGKDAAGADATTFTEEGENADADEKDDADKEDDTDAKQDDTTQTDIKDSKDAKANSTAVKSGPLKAGPLRAPGDTEIDAVSITVTPPMAGLHSTNATSRVSTTTEGISVSYASFKAQHGYSTDDPAELYYVEGQDYYVVIRLEVAEGYTLKKGSYISGYDIDVCDYNFGGTTTVTGGTLESAHFRSTAVPNTDSEIMYIWAKVTATKEQTKNLAIGLSEGGTYSVSASSDPYPRDDISTQMNMTIYSGDEVTITATPEDGYEFKGFYQGIIQEMHDPYQPGDGFVQDYDPDTLISTDNPYTFTVSDDVVIYALFEEIPAHDLTFNFLNMDSTSVPLTDLISSITVNGTAWPLPTSGTSVTGQIPEGANVTAVVKAADGYMFFTANPSNIPTCDEELSQDQSTYTFTFTMPESYPGLEPAINFMVSKAVDINFDVNGGTKGPAWPGDVVKYPEVMAAMITTWPVELTPVDAITGEIIAGPPAGARYAGIEITDKKGVHTGAPGERITNLDFSEGATIKYLWQYMYTVTFDTDGLYTPVPAEQTVPDGEKATQPVSPAKDEKLPDFDENGLSFRAWYTKPANEISSYYEFCYTKSMNPAGCVFDFNEPITQDTTAYAVYEGVLSIRSYDVTNSSFGGGMFEYNNYNSLIPSTGDNTQHFAFYNMPEFLKAMPNDGYKFVGWSTSTSEEDILSTDAEYEYTFTKKATIYALFKEKLPTLTLHFSSLDGDDLVDPIVIEDITRGTTIETVVRDKLDKYWAWEDLFTVDGYLDSWYRTSEPLTTYTNYDEVADADISGKTEINEDMDIYVCMFTAIDEAEITITPPICGILTDTPKDGSTWSWPEQTNKPVFSAPDGKNYQKDPGKTPSSWRDMENDKDPFIGTFEGGETYKGYYWLKADFGYCFDGKGNPMEYTGTAKVNGGTFVKANWDWNYLGIMGTVTADHDWDDGKVTKEPTCTEPGEKTIACRHNGEDWHTEDATKTEEIAALGHDWDEGKITTEPTCTEKGVKTYTCKRDASHTKMEEIAALGHDWGEWEETKAPTVDEEGEETRTCSRCDETQTRAIPKIDPEEIFYRNTAGDGSTWEEGSDNTLKFTFERNIDDDVTFSHFIGIKVDGEDVPADKYTAESGSVIVELKPEYLNTLSVGKHTITALFDDGNNPEASFEIIAKNTEAPTTDPTTEPTTPSGTEKETGQKTDAPTDTKAGASQKSANTASANTGDETNMLLWITLMCVAPCAMLIGIGYKKKNRQ